jgi:hypothetical protein
MIGYGHKLLPGEPFLIDSIRAGSKVIVGGHQRQSGLQWDSSETIISDTRMNVSDC